MRHCERDFQQELAKVAVLCKYLVIVIPDVVPIKRNGFIPVAKKRPFDCLLITARQNYCLELKYGYNKQKSHQSQTERLINKVNYSYYVVRKTLFHKIQQIVYSVEQNNIVLFRSKKIEDLFKFFQQPSEYYNKEGLDVLIPSKKKRMRKVYC